jgi:hypothetical protein
MYRQKYIFPDTCGFRLKRGRLGRRPPFMDGISSIYLATWVSVGKFAIAGQQFRLLTGKLQLLTRILKRRLENGISWSAFSISAQER